MYEQNRNLFNAILRNMVDAIIVIDPKDHVIQYVNPAWERLTGYSNSQAVGKRAFFVESELTPADVFQHLWQAVQAGQVGSGTLKGKRADGKVFEVQASVTPVQGADKEIVNLIATLHDVTEKQKLEAHKTAFLVDAANDLRTPMSSLKLRLYLLRKTPERTQDHLDAMENLIEQIDTRVNDLVLLSTLSYEKPIGDRKRLNMNDVLKRVTWANWPMAHDKGLTLSFNITQDPLVVLVDSDQIERVVVNLVANALTNTPTGGKIQLTATQSGNEIVFTVQDTGMGIPQQTLPLLFDQFNHHLESNCPPDGNRMELAIVKAIVEQHNGRIVCESAEGQGSVFKVYLPAA
jgi:PAS domain S-box-containing protein